MHRRHLPSPASLPAAVLAALLFTAAGAEAGPTRTLSMPGATYPSVVTGTNIGNTAIRDELDRLTGSTLRVDLTINTLYGSDNQALDAVVAGAVDLLAVVSSVVTPLVPELGLTDMPFLFRDRAHAVAVLDGPIGQAFADKFRAKGLELLAFGEIGFRHLTNGKRPVRAPADLAGLKVRVVPNEVYKLTFETLGAQVVQMAFPEVYTALRESRIDGQETPLTIIQSSRFSEVQRHLTLTGHVYSPLVYVMNRDSFAMLSADQKASLLAAAKAGAALTRKVAAESEQQILEGLKTQGMQVVDAVDHEAFAKALAPAMPEFARRFGADTIARVRDTR